MSVSRHTYAAREVGFFVEAAVSPWSVASVEWIDNGGVVEIYHTTDPLQTIRGIASWTKFTKPGSSGTFDAPQGTRKIAIEAASVDAQSPSSVAIIRDGVSNMEQARLYGVDQLDSPITAPPIPFFPNQADLQHHYDYTDINTLWQDSGLSVPITANGQTIIGVTDKGAGAVNLNKGLTNRVFDNVSFPFSVAGGDGNGAGVNSGFVSGAFPPPQTFFVVYQVNVDSVGDVISLEGTSGFKISTKGDIAFNSWYNSLQLTSGAPDEHDKWLAAVVMHRANSTQSLWHSQDAIVRTGTVAAITLELAGDIDVCAFNTNGSNPNRGPVAEVGAWNVDDVGVPTLVDDFKTYTSNEYGVVWE